jgi:sulfur carrier protein ThiS adenylyltransferase
MNRDLMRKNLAQATVGIAGLGGLGSTCAVALARAGVGRLILADYDRIEASNLDRQYYFQAQLGAFKTEALAQTIRAIDPSLGLELHTVLLGSRTIPSVFNGATVIVEALDQAESKILLIETCLRVFPSTHIVAASGIAGIGCFEKIKVLHRGRLHICGDLESEAGPDLPPVAPRVGIVANLQADTVLELLLESQR